MLRPDHILSRSYGFHDWLSSQDLELPPTSIDTLWLNITRLCNQSCRHCHMEASPDSPWHMANDVIFRCLIVLEKDDGIQTVDITGGAPELHPRFEQFVETCRMMGKHVVVRHNLTVTLDGHPLTGESKQHLPEFFTANHVEILASLPYCDAEATDAMRGRGVFWKSIESLRHLNAVGYGSNPGLILKLVANSDGPLCKTDRVNLEQEFRETLSGYGITFDDLLTVTNMPVGRYAENLKRIGRYETYMASLIESASDTAAVATVCRSQISVGIDGRLYDCDFNVALGLPIGSIFNFDHDALVHRNIAFGNHCFGCVAGAGSG